MAATSRKCFLVDKFISLTECDDKQVSNADACGGCQFVDTAGEGTDQTEKICGGCKKPNLVLPSTGLCVICSAKIKASPGGPSGKRRATCATCKRPDMAIVAKGMCSKCYVDSRKKPVPDVEAKKIEHPQSPPAAPVGPPNVEIKGAYETAEEVAARVSAMLRKIKPIQGDESAMVDPEDVSLIVICMAWVFSLYWLSGCDFDRGAVLSLTFLTGSVLSSLAVWLRRRQS